MIVTFHQLNLATFNIDSEENGGVIEDNKELLVGARKTNQDSPCLVVTV